MTTPETVSTEQRMELVGVAGPKGGKPRFVVRRPKTPTTPKAAPAARKKKTQKMGKHSQLNKLLRSHGLDPKQVRAGAAELRKEADMQKTSNPQVSPEMRAALKRAQDLEHRAMYAADEGERVNASFQLTQATNDLARLVAEAKFKAAGYTSDPYPG